jgi:hypothetical protein
MPCKLFVSAFFLLFLGQLLAYASEEKTKVSVEPYRFGIRQVTVYRDSYWIGSYG